MLALLSIAVLMNKAAAEPVDFDTQVIPILTKAGCNTGACHGAAAGRGGFHLSLYGSRPDRDFDEIVRALEGRRLNRRNSENSLLLLKPTEQLNHEGGTRIELDGSDFQTLKRWVHEGASRLQRRQLTGFRVVMDKPVVENLRQPVQLSALAEFGDGTERDVSRWTVFSPEDFTAVSIDEIGVTKINRRGRHVIVARYLDRVEAIELIAPLAGTQTVAADEIRTDSIDGFINRRLVQMGLKAVSTADDATIVRRLFLDLTGRLPTPAEAVSYASERSATKKEELVESLLGSREFIEFWTFRLAKLFRVDSRRSDATGMKAYYNWLQQAVVHDTPFNRMAEQMLLSEGAVRDVGPANFYAVTADARAQAELTSRIFLGVRLQCANCHDHPLDSWTQDDYHGLSAIFARVKRGAVIRVTQSGEVIHPGTGEAAVPKIPGQPFLTVSLPKSVEPAGGSVVPADPRVQLAQWMVSAQNPYFARAMVNRLWSYLMGRGLVEPVDDHRATNPATHPDLLNWLTRDFVDHDMRLRQTIRRICLSDVYARASNGAATMPEFYASAIPKPLAAEVLLDAVSDVTGVPGQKGVRAIWFEGLMRQSEAVTLLSGCSAGEDCESSVADTDDLSVQLHLLNGPLINQKISGDSGFLARYPADDTTPEELVEICYLRLYSRRPTTKEKSFWKKQFAFASRRDTVREIAEDFLWSLLTSREFVVNH